MEIIAKSREADPPEFTAEWVVDFELRTLVTDETLSMRTSLHFRTLPIDRESLWNYVVYWCAMNAISDFVQTEVELGNPALVDDDRSLWPKILSIVSYLPEGAAAEPEKVELLTDREYAGFLLRMSNKRRWKELDLAWSRNPHNPVNLIMLRSRGGKPQQ